MKPLVVIGALALVGCAYQPMRFGLHVSDLEAGSVVAADARVHRALVYALDATTSLRPEAVEWVFGGVFEPGPEPGTFKAKGPGEGTIQATFKAGDRNVLSARLTARSTGSSVATMPRPTAAPTAPPPRPTPEPTPEPTPAPPDAEALILESYRLQGEGDFYGAVLKLVAVTEAEWLPKARALMAEWGERGAEQGLARARFQLEAGNRALAKETLDAVVKLPLRPSQRQAERALRLKLSGRP